jgi:lipopolysaccharide exporter
MTTVRRSIVFSFIETYASVAINLVSFMLLARMLSPKEVGLYSVALALLSIAQVIRDFGMVSFLIQKKELNDEHIASAWALALIFGCGLFLLVQLAAPSIGAFYGDAHLTSVARVIAINFLILPFNSVCLALLRREMGFQKAMRINLAGAFLSTVGTVILAWMGAGTYSLAIGSVANNAIIAMGLWQVGVTAKLRSPQLLHWREILHFGGPLTLSNIVTSISMDINDLAVGKILGFHSVAIASRAQGLMNLFHKDFMTAVRNVAYPAFSKANRSGEPMDDKFLASLTSVTAIAWTFYGFTALFSLEIMRLIFGPQWDQSVPLVPIFCLAGAFSALVSLVPTIMLAAGHSRPVAAAELIIQPVRAIGLCLVIYYFRELRLFALGYLAITILSVPYFYLLKQRYLPTDFRSMARNQGRNLLLTLMSLAPALVITTFLRSHGQPLPYPLVFGCAAATCVAWVTALWLLKHPLHREIVNVVRVRFPTLP